MERANEMKRPSAVERLWGHLQRRPSNWMSALLLTIIFTAIWLGLETLLYKALNYFWG